MNWIFVLIAIMISVIFVSITKIISSKFAKNSGEEERKQLVGDVKKSLDEIDSLLQGDDNYASKLQFNTISVQLNEANLMLDSQKEKLKGLEAELKTAQRKIDEKELIQQELKSSKEEDEEELDKLLNDYDKISEESRELEKELAEQIESLDKQRANFNLTSQQGDFLETLNETLEESAGNLRTLITEHEQMVNRLTEIKQQLGDLEGEYSKLVEKQLNDQ